MPIAAVIVTCTRCSRVLAGVRATSNDGKTRVCGTKKTRNRRTNLAKIRASRRIHLRRLAQARLAAKLRKHGNRRQRERGGVTRALHRLKTQEEHGYG